MIRIAEKRGISGIIELQHQVDMVHHVIRPDFRKNILLLLHQIIEMFQMSDVKHRISLGHAVIIL